MVPESTVATAAHIPDPGGGHGRLRVHGRGALPGLADRPRTCSTCRCARSLAALCGRDAAATAAAADRYGFGTAETDWRALLERDDVQLIDVCTPGDSHARSPSPRWTRASTCCARSRWPTPWPKPRPWPRRRRGPQARGVRSMVGFNYRRVPALALARELIASGRVGEIRHVRAAYLQDWLSDPAFPLTWRLQREHAGSGALGDLGAHVVDLAQYLTGQLIAGVSGVAATFVPKRPLPGAAAGDGVREHGPGHRGRRGRRSRPGWNRGPWPRSRRPGSPQAGRTRCGSRSTGSAAAWPSTWSG